MKKYFTTLKFQRVWCCLAAGFLLFYSKLIVAQCWQNLQAGGYYNLAIKTDGSLWAWGVNTYGQLGNGTNGYLIIRTKIGIADNWQTIAAGLYHSIAIKSDGPLGLGLILVEN